MVARYLLLVLLAATAYADKARFDNYRLYRVVPENLGQLEVLKSMEELSSGLDFWTDPSHVNASVDIMVAPHKLPEFQEILLSAGIKNHVQMYNVQEAIDNEQPPSTRAAFGWTNYYRIAQINEWLDSVVAQNPRVVSSIIGGSSFEGRQIKGVKISYKTGNPIVFIESGIHAREWIAPATVTYIINQLLTSNDAAVRDIAENYDWYIFPSVNPDGYEYTHTTNRMWRKTRSRSGLCYGADPNRNWGFQWMTGGASSSACSDTYGGSSAFSEVETRSLSQYISTIGRNIKVYLAFHSYSQLLLLPYGNSNQRVSNYNTLMSIGNKAKTSLAKKYGTSYQVGNIVDLLYVASGGSMDWVRATYNTPVTFTYELRDTGRNGFTLPASQIIPTGQETLDSVVTILQEARSV